jgi:hypothetical protein
MTEMTDPMDANATMAKRNRNPDDVEPVAGTPNPKDKKTQRSVLKGTNTKENDEKTRKNEDDKESDDDIADPPTLKRDKGKGDDGKANLESKFDDAKEEKHDGKDKTIEKDKEKEKKEDEKEEQKTEEGQQENKEVKEKETPEDTEDKMDVDLYSLDLHHKGYKRHTDEWKKISDAIMKPSKNLVANDTGYIKSMMQDIAKEMKLDLTKMERDEWVDVFANTKEITNHKNHKRFIRIFGVSLASSNPKELFSEAIFDGNKLVSTDISKIWAAAYIFYGPGWRKEWIELGKKPTFTKLYRSCTKQDIAKAKPFAADEVFDEDPNSLHNLEITMKKICDLKTKQKEIITAPQWSVAMKKNFSKQKVKNICLRLAKTPVSVFEKHGFLHDNQLDKMSITCFWKGACQLLGQEEGAKEGTDKATPTEKDKPQPTTPKEVKTPNDSAPASAFRFSEDTKAAKKPGNRLFISKAKPKVKDTTLKMSKRKFNGYYKVKLPATVNPFGTLALAETTTHFANLCDAIWSIDKKAEVLPWYNTNSVKALTKGNEALKTKEQLNKYTPSVYIEQGKNTWLRFNIAHDVAKEKFIETEAFSNAQLQVSYDKVQAKKPVVWGWMLGGIPETANLNDMKEACENHPLLKEFQIEARVQVIRVFAGKQNTPVHLQVKAIHIIGDDLLTAKGRKAFNKVFGSRNEGGFPQQRIMRFIPHIADPRFPTSQARVKDVVKMIAKQKNIMKNAKVINTDTISSLHYYVPQIGYTLCQLLMSMRAPSDTEVQLFMAVDERSYGGYAVSFTVHKDRLAEATALIPQLNLIMEAKFGARIWEWFTDTAKDASQGYVYDKETGRIRNMAEEEEDDESSIESEENDFVLELSESLNISSEKNKDGEKGDAFDLDLSFMLDDENPKNQYGDSGSVKTFKSACQAKKTIDLLSSDEETDEEKDKEEGKDEPKIAAKSNKGEGNEGPRGLSIDTSTATQETSTLTQDTSTISESTNPEQAFAQMCIQNPDLLAKYLKSKSEQPGESNTPAQNTDPRKASLPEGDEAS